MPIDTARYASQSDPDCNKNFSRNWGFAALHRETSRRQEPTSSLARRLDREADAELQQGHHRRAEHLAQQAFDLREAAR